MCSGAGLVVAAAAAAAVAAGCGTRAGHPVTLSGSAVGKEGEVLRLQVDRFRRTHPTVEVVLRVTPDAADERHQLYVQWLNARADDPDVLQLDTIWTAEFAAAGWIAPLDRLHPPVDRLLPAAVAAGRWRQTTYALPWFVDVGMLYRRTDLAPRAPRDLAELAAVARGARRTSGVPYGLVWQGARYEGLVTVFLEYLGAFGGSILDDHGQVAVDSVAAQRALTLMRDEVGEGIVPEAALTWQEEQTRFAFQNGEAAFMRNWPYAYALLSDPAQSSVAGRFAVSPMPAGPGGKPTATLGGSALAINAHSDRPDDAYRLIEFLLQPEQMIERARITGQYPPDPSLYQSPALADVLPIPPREALGILNRAVTRPATPVYSQLSGILQVSLHRALTRQEEPAAALRDAAEAMRALLQRVKLGMDGS